MKSIIPALFAIFLIATSSTQTSFGFSQIENDPQNQKPSIRTEFSDDRIPTNLMLVTVKNLPIPGDQSTDWQAWKKIQDEWLRLLPYPETYTSFYYTAPTFREEKYIIMHSSPGKIIIFMGATSGLVRCGYRDSEGDHDCKPYIINAVDHQTIWEPSVEKQ